MNLPFDLPRGIYLADIHHKTEECPGHFYTLFHQPDAPGLPEVADAVRKATQDERGKQIGVDRRLKLVPIQDSLWGTLKQHLHETSWRRECKVYEVRFIHSGLYRVLEHAELALAFINLANQPKWIDPRLERFVGCPEDGALTAVLACLQTFRALAVEDDRNAAPIGLAVPFLFEVDRASKTVLHDSQLKLELQPLVGVVPATESNAQEAVG